VQAFPDAVRDFQLTLGVSRPDREADVVAIRYEGRDRVLVQAVPNLLAQRFIATRNDVRTQQARGTADFLDEQIAALTGQQDQAGDALRAYRERYGVVSLEAEGEAQVKRLADMQARREELESERSSLAALMRTIENAPRSPGDQSPYRALVGFPRLLASTAAPDLLRSLNELEAERARLLDRRTLEAPEVQVWTEQIRLRDAELKNIATTFLEGLTSQIRNIDATLAGFTQQLQAIPEKELQLARLRRAAVVNDEIYKQLQLKLKESQLMAALVDPSVRIVEPAILPRKPIRPNVPLSIVLALMAGLTLGVGAAFTRDQLDDTVHTRDELQLLAGTPVLGAIPRIALAANGSNGARRRGKTAPDHARLVDEVAGTPVTEAYRSLRTNINFSRSEKRPRVLVVTSPAPGDGKSTTAANLASTMTKQGLSCLIVDADLRRGTLHGTFGAQREPGLTNVLMGETSFDTAVNHFTGQPDFIATGTLPPNPAELLGSTAMQQLLATVAERYDTIVLDAPPMNLVTDAAVLARFADGVIVVARAGVTSRDAISYTVAQLDSVRANVLGTVLNDADLRRENHYGAYMQNYYSTRG
jgi:tyrosine-protein kinase Etk/Wzc